VIHVPVLQKEVLQYLDPKPNENFIDATIGGAGHTFAILEKNGPNGKVLGIDQDPEIIENLKFKIKNFKKRIVLVWGNFAELQEIVKKNKFTSVSGILFDLGMSSWHLEESGRGFSFQRNEPLDMRYNIKNPFTAEKIVNYWSEREIEKILKEYGEEKFAKLIAKKIVEERKFKPIKTTLQLVKIIEKAVPEKYKHQRIHFATRTFQALRIAVNDELNNLKTVLPQALEVLKIGGRMVVISFHSLEDRIVKNFFREKAKENLIKIITKKPIRPTQEEIKINPRSRSSKLRAATKL
jgi:16S rRNA (cytosine1402-N4)-methyltransferase